MGRDEHLGSLEQRVVQGGIGLALEHVERGRGDMAGCDCRVERVEVDEAPPACVDEDQASGGRREPPIVDEVVGAGGERAVEGHDVAGRHELVQVDELDAGLAREVVWHERIASDDVEAERPGPNCHRPSDPAEADHAQAPPADPVDLGQQVGDDPAPCRPPSGRDRREAAGRREQEHQGVVGHLVDAVVGDARDRDARFGGGREVDVVDPDAAADDGPQVGGVRECRAADRRDCGLVVWESKNDGGTSFDSKWIDQARTDLHEHGAQYIVIVANAVPKKKAAVKADAGGILVTTPDGVEALALVVHQLLVAQATQGLTHTAALAILASGRFQRDLGAVVKDIEDDREALAKEQREHEKGWDSRRQRTLRMLERLVKLVGDMTEALDDDARPKRRAS